MSRGRHCLTQHTTSPARPTTARPSVRPSGWPAGRLSDPAHNLSDPAVYQPCRFVELMKLLVSNVRLEVVVERTDGRADGLTGGRTDGRTGGGADGR